MKKKVVVIGAGPAGLTAAYELSKRNVETILLEKENSVGGLSRTIRYKKYYFDIGGHRFFTLWEEINSFWKEILGKDFLYRKRLSRIFFHKKFFSYPLQPFNTLRNLGLLKSLLIISSYLKAHVFPLLPEDTFERWVANRFGRCLYRIFFKSYTEKILGVSCKELDAEWAAQRISGLSFISAVKHSVIKKQNHSENGKTIKTLIDGFYYPKLGPGMMWQRLAEISERQGATLYTGANVEGIFWKNNRIRAIEVLQNGKYQYFEGTHFVSSMPLQELIRKMKPEAPSEILEAANTLRYRDYITVVLMVNKRDVFPDNWLYIHEPDLKVGRIQNYKNWSPEMVPDNGKTCLGLEYFCQEGDELWNMPDQKLLELGIRELCSMGFAQSSDDVEDGTVLHVPKAYPLYKLGYRESLYKIKEYLKTIENLYLIGRNGTHTYNNQDHSMMTGMLAAEDICAANCTIAESDRQCIEI
ncbi:MAG: NAD(P)/FAD-dependent oxidoreductase [Planctomycetes bacterium]|nr:NAD(P)/FAD-dependent oxidoreductase [Planctomycetota bacterium]MBM4064400.1 NAD(P)/FAD-dependent oxidoreductase [Planctomycetota bacterium]